MTDRYSPQEIERMWQERQEADGLFSIQEATGHPQTPRRSGTCIGPGGCFLEGAGGAVWLTWRREDFSENRLPSFSVDPVGKSSSCLARPAAAGARPRARRGVAEGQRERDHHCENGKTLA
jgi:hypothetical protein